MKVKLEIKSCGIGSHKCSFIQNFTYSLYSHTQKPKTYKPKSTHKRYVESCKQILVDTVYYNQYTLYCTYASFGYEMYTNCVYVCLYKDNLINYIFQV